MKDHLNISSNKTIIKSYATKFYMVDQVVIFKPFEFND